MIKFDGLRAIRIRHLGQGGNDKFELRSERFAIENLACTNANECAFVAVSEDVFPRRLTGSIRIKMNSPITATVDHFVMEEHGTLIEGVMTRYRLPASSAGRQMLKKYDDVFWGGNFGLVRPE